MTYDVKAIMDKLAKMNEKRDSLKWAKFDIGTHHIRILPMVTPDNQPLAEISFYRNEKLVGPFKSPVAAQFGLEDPIHETIQELAKDRSKESWELRKQLNSLVSWFVPIVIRGKEEEGVQIWEMKKDTMQGYLTQLTSEDWREVDLLDPTVGHDWTLNVTASDKKFKTYTVKNFQLIVRPKASKLSSDKAVVEKLLGQVPDLFAYYKGRVMEPNVAKEKLSAFMDAYTADPFSEAGAATSSAEGQERTTAAAGDDSLKRVEDTFADV